MSCSYRAGHTAIPRYMAKPLARQAQQGKGTPLLLKTLMVPYGTPGCVCVDNDATTSSGSQVRQATLANSALPAEDSTSSRVTASSLICLKFFCCTWECHLSRDTRALSALLALPCNSRINSLGATRQPSQPGATLHTRCMVSRGLGDAIERIPRSALHLQHSYKATFYCAMHAGSKNTQQSQDRHTSGKHFAFNDRAPTALTTVGLVLSNSVGGSIAWKNTKKVHTHNPPSVRYSWQSRKSSTDPVSTAGVAVLSVKRS